MSDKVVKYKRPFSINLGIIIFIMIIVYVIFNIFSYFTKKSIAEYEVIQGSIASNDIYQGLILRDESIYYANQNGYLNYYVANGSKVCVHDMVYSIDSSGDIYDKLTVNTTDDSSLSKENIIELSNSVDNFMNGYSSNDYGNVILYKDNLSSDITQAVNNQRMSELSDLIQEAEENNSFFKGYATQPGVVQYYLDGYEGITWDNYSIEDLNKADYKKQILSNQVQVTSSDPVYKTINSEEWHIIFKISGDVAEKINNKNSVKIRFCEDDFTTNASFSIEKKEGEYYLNLKLYKGMIRYINERFVNVELVISERSGLKIPNSSITEKDFYTIPCEYFMKGGDSDSEGFLVKHKDDSSNDYTFVAPTIYFKDDSNYYYIDSEYVTDGDLIQMPGDSSVTYTIGNDIGTLTGVYNINKGYAVFKQINIIYQNEEYTIVEPKTTYGISLYDHIALNASSLKENELIVN